MNVPSKSTTGKQKNLEKKIFFIGILKVTDESIRPWYESSDPDPYRNVSDPEHFAPLLVSSQRES